MIDQFVEVATRQIGTTDAALKQYVAGEHAVFFLAIIHQATGRMSGDMDRFQFGVSEGDDISDMQVIFPAEPVSSCNWKPNIRLCFGASSIQNSSALLASADRPNSFSINGLPKMCPGVDEYSTDASLSTHW